MRNIVKETMVHFQDIQTYRSLANRSAPSSTRLLGLHGKLSGSIFSHHTKLFEARTQAQYNWKENEKGCAYGESDYAQPFIYPDVSYNVRSILDECGILRALILRNLQYIHRLFQ